MARKAGSADLPLHGGQVPKCLADQMTELGASASEDSAAQRCNWREYSLEAAYPEPMSISARHPTATNLTDFSARRPRAGQHSERGPNSCQRERPIFRELSKG